MQRLVRQTVFLSVSHFIVRMIGFIMRIWLSRELGTLAMGLVELAQSAQMLLITPVVTGLPSAISRMCAKEEQDCRRTLLLGTALSLLISLPLAAMAFVFRVPLALWLGDLRTLPALLVYLPCLPVLGVSCVLNGYYYGVGKPVPPALSELLEQTIRLLLCLRLTSAFSDWPVAFRSALPAAAALAGETAGLLLMLVPAAFLLCRKRHSPHRRSIGSILTEMLSLALPLTGMRMVTALMRTVSSALLPKRLALSGLPAQEALSRLGVMHGMMMPILLLPSFITCSLCSVAAPELARRQSRGLPLRSLIRRSMRASALIGLAAMCGVWLCAPFIAHTLYRQAELTAMLRISCPLVPVMALSQVAGGLMNGLGLQGQSLRIALLSSLLSLLLMYVLCANSHLRIYGAIIALAAAQSTTLLFSLRCIRSEIRKEYTSR